MSSIVSILRPGGYAPWKIAAACAVSCLLVLFFSRVLRLGDAVEDVLFVLVPAGIIYWLAERIAGSLPPSSGEGTRVGEDRLAGAFESGRSIMVIDREDRITFANGTAAAMFGTVADDLEGMTADYRAWDPAGPYETPIPKGEHPVARVLATGLPLHDQRLSVRRRDGSRVVLSLDVAPLHMGPAAPTGVVASFIDVTEPGRADALRMRSLSLAVEQIPLAVMVADATGRIEYVNPGLTRMTGRSSGDLVGTRWVCPAGHHPETCAGICRAIETGVPWQGELPGLRKDGEPYRESAFVFPVRDESGAVAGFFWLREDVTERRKVEEALRESREKYRSLVETIDDWVWEVDENGVYTYASPKVRDLLGYEPSEVIGRTPFAFMPESEAERVEPLFRSLQAERLPIQSLENVNVRKDGRRVVLETSGTPFYDAAGTFRGYRGVDRDITERKRQEKSLARTKELLERIFSNIHILTAYLDRDFRIIRVNRAYAEADGRPPEFFAGKGHFDLYPHPENEAIFREVLETGQPYFVHAKPFTYPEAPERGTTYWDWSLQPVMEPDGTVGGLILTLLDVTERKRAEEEAAGQHAFLEAVESSLSSGLVAMDLGGRIIHANNAFCAMIGWTREELTGAVPPYPYYPPEDEEAADGKRLPIREALSRNDPSSAGAAEQRYVRRSGERFDVLVNASLLKDSRGAVIGYVASVSDITDRKKAEEALRQSEERFRQLFEQNKEAVLLFRAGTADVVDANPAAQALYGRTREELAAHGPSLFVPPESLRDVEEAIREIDHDTVLDVPRMILRRRDGNAVVAAVRGHSIRLREGRVSHLTFRDITERVRLEEEAKHHQAQLIHASRMASLGAVVSGVAHEINNPNNLIMFNAPLVAAAWADAAAVLEERHRGGWDFDLGGLPYSEMREAVPRLLDGIADASRRIQAIVTTMKDFARPAREGEQAPVDLNGVVRAAVAILNHEIMKGTHNFEVRYGEDLPPVSGSAQELEQVVVNLLLNALQALPDSRRGIRVETALAPENDGVELRVTDEGTGMSEEVLARIAEPFFSTRLEAGGLGLGVSICRSIVAKCGGTLTFDSAVGRGTTARVRLPRIPAPEPVGAPERDAKDTRKPRGGCSAQEDPER